MSMAMNMTKNNCKAAVEIMKVLADNKCTVDDTLGILLYVDKELRSASTVPKLDYQAILEKLTSYCD